MTEELKNLLTILAIAIPIGLFVGVAIRKLRPAWCKSYTKFCVDGKWWMFLFFSILFTGLSINSFFHGRFYSGIFQALFALLEVIALFAFGFKRLTPEQAVKIDASDPTKL